MRCLTDSALARERSESCDSSAVAPDSWSARVLFWLAFHFPSSLEIRISTETMPLIMRSM